MVRLVGGRTLPVLLALYAATLALCENARAGGEIYMRQANKANIADCDAKLVEQLHEAGNMHGFYWKLSLACMSSPTEANWVLISGISCDDESEAANRCNNRKLNALPPFVHDLDFWEAADHSKPPYKMDYTLLKYAFGENCTVETQPYSKTLVESSAPVDDKTRDIAQLWHCKSLRLFDGTEYGVLIDTPRKLKSVRVETVSDDPMQTFFKHEPFPSDDNVATDILSIDLFLPIEDYVFQIPLDTF